MKKLCNLTTRLRWNALQLHRRTPSPDPAVSDAVGNVGELDIMRQLANRRKAYRRVKPAECRNVDSGRAYIATVITFLCYISPASWTVFGRASDLKVTME